MGDESTRDTTSGAVGSAEKGTPNIFDVVGAKIAKSWDDMTNKDKKEAINARQSLASGGSSSSSSAEGGAGGNGQNLMSTSPGGRAPPLMGPDGQVVLSSPRGSDEGALKRPLT